MFDLVIIGAGLAGLTAAYTAASAGLSVRVVAKGMGATHWHAGTVDVLGYRPGEDVPVAQPFRAIADMAQEGRVQEGRVQEDTAQVNEQHPYALMGAASVRESIERFATLTHGLGLPYHGAAESGRTLLLPSPVGAARPVYLAPAAQAAGTLENNQSMLIVGFDGLRDFYPKLIVDNLNKQGWEARAGVLPISLITTRRQFNTVLLAKFLDDPGAVQKLAGALSALVRPGERIGLPAILGLQEHARTVTQLQEITGAAVFEIPTLPPSVPGIRLMEAFRHHLRGMGVRVEIGMDVHGFAHEGDIIRWIETETSAPRPRKHRARTFLLATGGILGGGITSDHTGRVWETIFDLPLTTPQTRAQWFRPHFLHAQGQPVYRGGVRVDHSFQPVDGNGSARAYANLWAAGGTLANADPIRERSLEGIAIATGMRAAEQIVASLK